MACRAIPSDRIVRLRRPDEPLHASTRRLRSHASPHSRFAPAAACDADARPSQTIFTTIFTTCSQRVHNHHHNVFTTVSGGGGFGLGSSTVGYLLNRGSFRFRKGEAVPLEREEKGNEPELRRHNQRPWPRWRCAMAHVCHDAAIAANARRACERGGRKEDLAWRWWASVEPSDKSS